MSHPDRCLLALFCFLFVAILYASFGCNDCNPYRMEQGNTPDTINADSLQFYVDPNKPHEIQLGVYKDGEGG
jgi:hypothetical protein